MFANTEIRSRGIECSQLVSVKIGVGGMSHVEEAQSIESIRIREDGSIVGERPGGAEESCSFGQISTVKESDTHIGVCGGMSLFISLAVDHGKERRDTY